MTENNSGEKLTGIGVDGEEFGVVKVAVGAKINISNSSHYRYSFSPPGPIIVTENDGEHKMAVVTCHASEYYAVVKASMEALATETEESLAERFGTSVPFARYAKERLLDMFSKQLEAGNESEEILTGLVVNKNQDIYAVGRRILPSGQRKVSKLTMIRRSLPVGRLAVYPTSANSAVHELRSGVLDKKVYAKDWARVSELYMPKTEKALVVVDTKSYRERCGRTLLPSEARWKAWNADGSLDNAVIALVQGKGVVLYDREELVGMDYKDIYSGYDPVDDAVDLEAVYNAIVVCRERFADKPLDISVYLPGYGKNLYNFTTYIVDYINNNNSVTNPKTKLRVSFARYGTYGANLLNSLDWKLRSSVKHNINGVFFFDYSNKRLKDFMFGYGAAYKSFSSGIEFDPQRTECYVLSHGKVTLADFAALLGIDSGKVLVNPKYGSGPPYVFSRGNTFMITATQNIPDGVLAMGAKPGTILDTGSIMIVLSKDSPELLAKGSVL